MQRLKTLWQVPIVRAGLAVVLVLLVVGITGFAQTQTPPPQPIQFPHSVHVGLGIQCLYCHPAATWGPTASLPETSKCWGCHQQMKSDSGEIAKLAAYVNKGQEIPWVPVAIEPDFVHFNHQPHILAGVACETCHGDLSKMTTAVPQNGQNMGWCLNCHKTLRPEQFKRLSDCSTCHY
jgi:hypothetical protein